MTESIFLRNSSGLVKTAKPFDVLIFNLGLISVGIAVTLGHFFIPANYTGADLVIAEVIAGIFMAVIAFAFWCWTSAIPRSGGVYSFVSRGVHPLVGFGVSFIDSTVWLFYNTFAATFLVTIGIAPALFYLGVSTDNQTLQSLAINLQEPVYLFIIASLAIIVSGYLLIQGMKAFFVFQKIMFTIAIIGTVTAIYVLMNSTAEGFQVSFIASYSSYIDNPIQTIQAYSTDQYTYSFKMTVLAAVWPILSFVGSIFSVNIASEIQNVRKAQFFGMFGSIVLAIILMTLLSHNLNKVVTPEFQAALSNYYFSKEGANLPLAPYFSVLAAVVTQSPILIILICLGFFSWAFLWIPATLTYSARAVLAWSFDRIAPASLGFVHPQKFTPVNAIITVVIANLVFLVLFLFVPFFNSLILVLAAMLAWIPVMIGAIIFPYRKKSMYKETEISKYEPWGIPLISIAGFFGLLAVATLSVFLLFDEVATGPIIQSIGTILVLFTVAVVWYYTVKNIRKKKENIDISRAFDEIPID